MNHHRTYHICSYRHSLLNNSHNNPWCSPRISFQFSLIFIFYHFLKLIDTLPVNIHSYTDDIQLYTNCNQNPITAPSNISDAIKQTGKWLSKNLPMFQPLKTEILFTHLPLHGVNIINPPSVLYYGIPITFSNHVRHLRVIFDTTISFTTHISLTIKSIYYKIHQLRLIRTSISIDTAKLIASAYIPPIFDYCNSLLIHLQSQKITCLQTLQNSLIRCIFKMNHFSRKSISPLLINIHWLPIRQRILYKLLLLTHKAIHHNSPSYITSLIPLHPIPTTTTRSTKTFLIQLPSKYKKIFHKPKILVNSCPLQLKCYTNKTPLHNQFINIQNPT